ncbi:hypothetical protein [Thiothrix winogradskyi]|uniref:DUF4332 domain-containing protein n=1 Tax=Thiothrix winogradskyi TaxID=96472 RepID=A0ABY3SVU4_9GAMM|nr:hypothetical protein [Thiothrix winogradskyi]UJS22749.1 hypothetical protein L2Y54_12435 [Thiothrix winogradskyi]
MNTANTPYTFGMATGEIISLLLLSFVIGILLCRLFRQMGICCRPRKKMVPLGITPVPAGKYHTRDVNIYTSKPSTDDVYVPKVTAKPILTVPEVTPKLPPQPPEISHETTVGIPVLHSELPPLPEIDPLLAAIDPHKPILDLEVPEPESTLEIITMHNEPIPTASWELDPLLAGIDPHKPIIDLPDQLTTITTDPLLDTIDPHKPIIDLPDMPEISMKTDSLLDTIDPHKPIIDLPDMPEISMKTDSLLDTIDPHKPIIDLPDMPEISMKTDSLLDAIDPHKPIIDLPDMPEITMKTDPLLDAIDPHKPIIDPPDMPETSSAQSGKDATLNILNDWLHKAKDSVEHLTEKATPAANDWLHKAKDSVEHLKEKAAPVSSDWLHKAKDSVEHLKEKAAPVSGEWLHKAKEIGSGFSSKGSSLGSETLVKGSSTLASLAASAKELTEKLASNLSIKHDDLQKLTGIGPTFASVLHRAGIHTYQQLAETSPQKLQALLIVEDEQFSKHDTSSWPKQAALAAQSEWEQLKAYQDNL